jgi:uncharacterized protein (TIGR02594 family)
MNAGPLPRWWPIAVGEVGVHEQPGTDHEARILEYHRATTLAAKDDETNWCSSFVNWCLRQVAIPGTGNAAARSWLRWGQVLELPRRGAIAVLWRGKPDGWQGHVGFLDRLEGDRIWLLGGNQGNAVSIAAFPRARLLGYRWPAGAPTAELQRDRS